MRPTPCSIRCISYNHPSTSRASLSTTTGPLIDPNFEIAFRRAGRARAAHSSAGNGAPSRPRLLYNPELYRKSLPVLCESLPDPASTDPEFKKWIEDDTVKGGAKYKHPAKEGSNWLGGPVVSGLISKFFFRY